MSALILTLTLLAAPPAPLAPSKTSPRPAPPAPAGIAPKPPARSALPSPSAAPRWLGAPPKSWAPPARIVSLSPALTEWLYALGAGPQVVGVSRFADHPPAVGAVPKVGGMMDPNAELILALKPQLLLVTPMGNNRKVVSQLGGLGLPVFVAPASTVADGFHSLRALGSLLGRQRQAATLEAQLRAELEGIRAEARAHPLGTVLVVISWSPIFVAGPGSMLDELLTAANGVNAVRQGARYPQLSLEAVLALQPQQILDISGQAPPPLIAQRFPVRATQNKIFSRAGPRLPAALGELRRLLRPGSAGR